MKAVVRCLVTCLLLLWQYNPVKVIAQRQRRLYFVENYDGVMIKPKLKERLVDLFLTDYRRKQRLLHWVHTRLRSPEVHDFTTCWQDGTILCALLESICPGVCPSYYLLSHLNMVKNCRLGIKLANKYLYVPMDLLTPEEMAIAKKESEFKIIQYISMIRWASQNIKEKWSSLHESLIAAKTGRCLAKGSGLRNGIVGKRSKFTIVVSDTIGVFHLLVEVRGPNNEYFGEQVVSLHQAKGVLEQSRDKSVTDTTVKYLEDGVGNTFVRKQIPSRHAANNSADPMCLGFQCGEEGTFYVTYVPRRAGIHAVTVKWQNNHVENSPFRIKVYKASNVSTKSLKGAHEKRVIYDSLSVTTIPGNSEESVEAVDHREHTVHIPEFEPGARPNNAIAKSKAYSKGRQLTVTGRRVLRRIITRNGEDIVIEEAISPSLSRQSSITDNSDDDNGRHQRREKDEKRNSPLLNGTTFSYTTNNNPVNGKPVTSLGTVLEEKQNSKDNLFKNIDLSEVVRSPSFQQSLETFNMDTGSASIVQTVRGDNSNRNDVTRPEVDDISSRRDPWVRYTCTELNEHNILESNGKNGKEKITGSVGNVGDDKSASFWFTSPPKPADASGKPVKRSPLQRTMSIHGDNKKAVARRTTSDGTMYKLRRRIVSYTASDMSETSSEISSDDRQSGNEDDMGVAGHALKLLKSNSLKKACMYISEKALADDDVMSPDMTGLPFPGKTKLRATSSLPITHKSMPCLDLLDTIDDATHTRRSLAVSHDTISASRDVYGHILSGDITPSEQPSATRGLDTYNELRKDLNEVCVNVFITDGLETRASEANTSFYKAETGRTSITSEQPEAGHRKTPAGQSEAQTRFVSRHEQTINQKAYADQLDQLDTEAEELNERRGDDWNYWHHTSTLHKDVRPPSKHDTRSRGSLTRQWKVYCQRSSQESSSDIENDTSIAHDESPTSFKLNERDTRGGNRVMTDSVPTKTPFRSIFIQSNDDTGSPFTREVVILVPKAKVDKQTQVCDSEITRETGWDMLEGVYLLLRRISLRVPLITTCSPSSLSDMSSDGKSNVTRNDAVIPKSRSVTGSRSSASQSSRSKSDWSASNNVPGANLLRVPTENLSDGGGSSRISDTSSNPQMSLQSNTYQSQRLSNASSNDTRFVYGNVKPNNDHNRPLPNCSSDSTPFSRNKNAEENRGRVMDLADCGNLAGNATSPKSTVGKNEVVDEWFKRNESMLKVQQRQHTVETVDSGFDDNPTHFNRHARYSLPSLRTVNGHVRLHRRPYQGRIPLDPRLVNSGSSQSLSLDTRELGNEADDELMLNSSTEHTRQSRAHRRRHRLQNRDDSVSFSDSEINQRRHFTRKRPFGMRRQNVTQLQSRDAVDMPTVGVASPDGVDIPEPDDTNASVVTPIRTATRKRNAVDGTNGDLVDFTDDHVKQDEYKHPPISRSTSPHTEKVMKKHMIPRDSTTASSIDSTYCGFGISKPKRSVLLSLVGDFQNLCTTAEVPDEDMSVASGNGDVMLDTTSRGQFSNTNETANAAEVCDGIKPGDYDVKEGIMDNLNMFANDDFENDFSESELVALYENSLLNLQAEMDHDFESFTTEELSSFELQALGDWTTGELTNNENGTKVDLAIGNWPISELTNNESGTKVDLAIGNWPISELTNNGSGTKVDSPICDWPTGELTNIDDGTILDSPIEDSPMGGLRNNDDESVFDSPIEDSPIGELTNIDDGTTLDSPIGDSPIGELTNIDEIDDVFDEITTVDNACVLNGAANGVDTMSLFDDATVDDDDDDNDDDDVHVIRVAGAGLRHGLVGDTNSFQVWTESSSTGSLSVHITGSRSHMVTETSILYTGDNLYEVSYGVTHPGLYKIFVKWDEENIPESPFLCEVSM